MFEELVLQLQDDTVLIAVVDNVSELIYSNWRRETKYLVEKLVR